MLDVLVRNAAEYIEQYTYCPVTAFGISVIIGNTNIKEIEKSLKSQGIQYV